MNSSAAEIAEERLAADGRHARCKRPRRQRQHDGDTSVALVSTRIAYSRRPRAMASSATPARLRAPGPAPTPTATPMPTTQRESDRAYGEIQRARAAGDVKRIDCGRQQPHCSRRQQASERNGQDRAHAAKQRRLQPERPPAPVRGSRPARARADLGAPAHHRNRNRVVDEKCPDQQRDIAEDAQVPPKCRQHAPVRMRSGCLAG